jgi:hypothetical protein
MLQVNFDTFQWYRPKGKDNRFRWSADEDPLLMANGRDYEVYPPKNYKALFRTFAALGDDGNKILEFANKFGLLLGRSTDDIHQRGLRPSEDWPISAADMGSHGPSIFRRSDWLTRINEMKSLVELVDLMTNDIDHPRPDCRMADPVKNRYDLLRALRWQPPNANRKIGIGNPQSANELVDLAVAKIVIKYKDVVLRSTSEVSWDSKNRRPNLSIVPKTLGDFLYWQLCESFFEGAVFRQCEICGKWDRPDRPDCWSTCSKACRSKKYRNRKKLSKKRRAK